MNDLLLTPSAVATNNSNRFEYTDFEEVVEQQPVTKSHVSFLDANTNQISMDELKTQCVVPTWANQELTISHQDFIEAVHDAASAFVATSGNISVAVSVTEPPASGQLLDSVVATTATMFPLIFIALASYQKIGGILVPLELVAGTYAEYLVVGASGSCGRQLPCRNCAIISRLM